MASGRTDVVRDANGEPILTQRRRHRAEQLRLAVGDPTGPRPVPEEYLGPSLPTREIALDEHVHDLRQLPRVREPGLQGLATTSGAPSARSGQPHGPEHQELTNGSELGSRRGRALAKSLQTKKWIKPADFIKLREMSLTYQLPSSLRSR